ncbi:glucose-6-phosphate dehydrogenase assembly protein OpcA [soil metagenome]
MSVPTADHPATLETTTTRWHARSTSISDTVHQLALIWSGAARESQTAPASATERADAHGRATPDEARDVRVRMRTSVLTLVVVAQRPEIAERAMSIVNALASRHPSRAIVLSPGDPDGPTTFDAHIYAACHLSALSGAEVCTEEILVKTGGELSQHLATVVAPLLIHDLPVVLWWPGDPPFASRHFKDLAGASDGLLVDSGSFRDDGAAGLRGMAAAAESGHSVHDIGWMRLSLWRELLAGLFDHPLLTAELGNARHLRLDFSRPGSAMRISKAACFAGWVAAALNWRIDKPLGRDPDSDRISGSFRHGRRVIPVEFRPVRAGLGPSMQTAGSLVRVELESTRGRVVTRARVTRQADHLLATADWNGAQVARRAGRLEPFEEAPFLAESLDRTAHDPIFEMALDRAVELTASL